MPARLLGRRAVDFAPLIAFGPRCIIAALAKNLISFPGEAMIPTEEEFPIVFADGHSVIEEAKAAGVYIFGEGIDAQVDPVLVSGDGAVSTAIYSGSRIMGGFTILALPTRENAVVWARKIALACRCAQELRAFVADPAS